MPDALYRYRGKSKKDYNKHFDHDELSLISNLRCVFSIETYSRESIREHLGRSITDHRSLTPFNIDKIGLGFRMNRLRKVLTPINKSELSH
jgi:hypothetical protein